MTQTRLTPRIPPPDNGRRRLFSTYGTRLSSWDVAGSCSTAPGGSRLCGSCCTSIRSPSSSPSSSASPPAERRSQSDPVSSGGRQRRQAAVGLSKGRQAALGLGKALNLNSKRSGLQVPARRLHLKVDDDRNAPACLSSLVRVRLLRGKGDVGGGRTGEQKARRRAARAAARTAARRAGRRVGGGTTGRRARRPRPANPCPGRPPSRCRAS